MYLSKIRSRSAQVSKRLHLGERGQQSIEQVLILAVVAVILVLAFKFLWGTNSDGKVADIVTNVTAKFTTGLENLLNFGGNNSGGSTENK